MGHHASTIKNDTVNTVTGQDLPGNDTVNTVTGQDLHGDSHNDPEELASDQVLHQVVSKWREDGYKQWDDKAVSGLRQEFIECIDCVESKQNINIILCGGTGEGKSSLINNCMAAITGSYANVADHGGGAIQVTKKYQQIQSWTRQDGNIRRLPLTFFDTRGFSESKALGVPVAAIKASILGKVSPNEILDPRKTEEEWTNRRVGKNKASYIFVVADATIVPDNSNPNSVMSKLTTYTNLREIREFSKKSGIRTAAFLTMCDKLDPEVKKDISNLHTSKHVERKVKAFSKMIDIPESRIFPIINYTSEIIVSNGMTIQTLIALRGCLQDINADLFSKQAI